MLGTSVLDPRGASMDEIGPQVAHFPREETRMSGRDFDLDGYPARIGHTGRREPTLAVLRAIVAAHSATIPFENIDVFTRRGVSLDSSVLQRKMVRARRGGNCFEHNSLLREALLALGFRATGLMARVVRGLDADAITQRTHMMLRVDPPEGPYVADVGFGNLTPTVPLALALQEPAQHPRMPASRISRVGSRGKVPPDLIGANRASPC
jgi:N-hydroxyarylamine O-acetyltransferase